MISRNQNNIKPVLTLSVVALVMVVLAAGSVNAALVLEEHFDYDAGNINGRDGGIGFDGPWISTKSHGQDYQTGLTTFNTGDGTTLNDDAGLSFTDVNANEIPVAGSALSRYGSAGRAQAHRLLSSASQAALTGDDTTIWFSVLVSGTTPHLQASFIFGNEAFSTDIPFVLSAAGDGFGLTLANADRNNGDGTISAIAFNGSTTPNIVIGTYQQTLQAGGTHYDTSVIVGKINWKPNGTPDEFFLFNVTDLSSEPSEGEAFASITDQDLDQSAFNLVGMWDTSTTIFDEIRFATTFVEALGRTPIDPNAPSVDAGDDWITWSGEPVTANATVVNHDPADPPLTYAWTVDAASLADTNLTIELTNADQEDVTVKVSKTADTGDATVVTMTLAANNVGSGKPAVEDTMTIDVYDDSCKAANADGALEYDPADFDTNCITDLGDYAILAAAWLVDFSLTEPVAQ